MTLVITKSVKRRKTNARRLHLSHLEVVTTTRAIELLHHLHTNGRETGTVTIETHSRIVVIVMDSTVIAGIVAWIAEIIAETVETVEIIAWIVEIAEIIVWIVWTVEIVAWIGISAVGTTGTTDLIGLATNTG